MYLYIKGVCKAYNVLSVYIPCSFWCAKGEILRK